MPAQKWNGDIVPTNSPPSARKTGWSAPRYVHFTHRESLWACLVGMKNLAPTVIQSPDRRAVIPTRLLQPPVISIAAQVLYQETSIDCTAISTLATDLRFIGQRGTLIPQRIFDYNKMKMTSSVAQGVLASQGLCYMFLVLWMTHIRLRSNALVM